MVYITKKKKNISIKIVSKRIKLQTIPFHSNKKSLDRLVIPNLFIVILRRWRYGFDLLCFGQVAMTGQVKSEFLQVKFVRFDPPNV